mmetsp:Transcript_5011/g.12606  ORF Transcript_5011/g.12606 Transcript_5011/m.12606 type:complete len:221 (+) Transcript_5011:287-949(+)
MYTAEQIRRSRIGISGVGLFLSDRSRPSFQRRGNDGGHPRVQHGQAHQAERDQRAHAVHFCQEAVGKEREPAGERRQQQRGVQRGLRPRVDDRQPIAQVAVPSEPQRHPGGGYQIVHRERKDAQTRADGNHIGQDRSAGLAHHGGEGGRVSQHGRRLLLDGLGRLSGGQILDVVVVSKSTSCVHHCNCTPVHGAAPPHQPFSLLTNCRGGRDESFRLQET